MNRGNRDAWMFLSDSGIERETLFSDREIPVLEDLGDDEDALLDLVGDEVGGTIDDFVERGKFPAFRADVCESIVVVDGGHLERCGACLEEVRELQPNRVCGPEGVEGFLCPSFAVVDG